VKRFAAIVLTFTSVAHAAVLESAVTPPIRAKDKWKFLRKAEYFIQHRCAPKKIQRIDAWVEDIFAAKETAPFAVPPLQIRLYASQTEYRRAMLFSNARTAHYSEDRQMLLSSCSIDRVALAEHIFFHAVAAKNLRPWQKIFIAESLARKDNFFNDAEKKHPSTLRKLLFSNHQPEARERAAMRQLATALDEEGLLRPFIAQLLDNRTGDDTGLEILEKLFPEGLKNLE